jgi:starch-binding outer membrane protein, SusD/RagB family
MKYKVLIILISILAIYSCSDDFLDSKPQGKLSDEILNTPEAIDALCTAAYSALAGPEGSDGAFLSPTTNWIYGDVRAETAYKGGGGITDLWEFHAFETFTGVYATNGLLDRKWYHMYISVQRANAAIRRLNAVSIEDVPLRDVRLGEMKFLRAHFFFELSRLFNKIPYFDENVDTKDYINIPNDQFNRDEILGKIAQEFEEAAALLPPTQPDAGRVDKYAALAYQAKATLYRAYKQDELTNQVTEINQSLMAEVVTLCDEVAAGGYALLSDYQQLAEVEYEHGSESVFGVEYSIEDGTTLGRINWSNLVCTPRGPVYGGDGFFQPSQHLVNSFKTDAGGIPDFENYKTGNISKATDGFLYNIDPRLDFTVGRLGVPWKNYTRNYDERWSREPATYGYFSCKKFVLAMGSPYMVKGWPWGASSLNFQLIRYADVLLWKAEALIELGRQDEAVPLINQVRKRAKQSNYVKKLNSSVNAANYIIEEYKPGINCTWTKEYAQKALRFERKIELAMEGERFFDLVRWGVAAETMNDYFQHEKLVRSYINDETVFTAGKDEYFPVPQAQINFSGGLYKQNPGYELSN